MASKSVKELLGDTVIDKDGKSYEVSNFFGPGKVVGLYFSAHWCPPCRQFTPILKEFYDKVKEIGHDFEIIFISSDRSESDFKSYFGTMPWKAVDLEKDTSGVSDKYHLTGIPTFVLIDGETEETIDREGRAVVMKHQDGSGFPWKKS